MSVKLPVASSVVAPRLVCRAGVKGTKEAVTLRIRAFPNWSPRVCLVNGPGPKASGVAPWLDSYTSSMCASPATGAGRIPRHLQTWIWRELTLCEALSGMAHRGDLVDQRIHSGAVGGPRGGSDLAACPQEGLVAATEVDDGEQPRHTPEQAHPTAEQACHTPEHAHHTLEQAHHAAGSGQRVNIV